MSDPLSVTASVLAVATAAFQVAKALNELAEGIGSAGAEVRFYANELDSFAKLLRVIETHVSDREDEASAVEHGLLLEIVGVCKRTLEPIKSVQTKLSPLLERYRDSHSKLRSFGLRIWWIFSKKGEMLFYRGALRRQHELLDTTLSSMILKATSTRDKSPRNIQNI